MWKFNTDERGGENKKGLGIRNSLLRLTNRGRYDLTSQALGVRLKPLQAQNMSSLTRAETTMSK